MSTIRSPRVVFLCEAYYLSPHMAMAPLGWTCVKNETPKLKHGCTAYRSLPYLNLYRILPYVYLTLLS